MVCREREGNYGTFDGFELTEDFWLIAAHRGSEDEIEVRAARDGRAAHQIHPPCDTEEMLDRGED
jgi:hypothetical protein